MRRRGGCWIFATALGLALLLTACTGVTVGVGAYRYPGYYYGRGPYWGYGSGPIVVDPCAGGGCEVPPELPDGPVAVPLPEPPPDMGMPDFDMGGMDMDMGGFDF
jgi:hypothetical protein